MPITREAWQELQTTCRTPGRFTGPEARKDVVPTGSIASDMISRALPIRAESGTRSGSGGSRTRTDRSDPQRAEQVIVATVRLDLGPDVARL